MIRHKNIWPDKPVMMQLPEIYKGFMNLRLVEPSAAIFGANRQEDQRGYPLRFEDSSRWSISLWKFHKTTFQYKVIRFASRLILLFPANSGSDEPRIGNPELFSKFSRRPPVWTKPELKLVNNSAQPEDAIVDKFLFGQEFSVKKEDPG